MFVKKLDDCNEFIANDGCRIREVLHRKNDPVDLPYSLAVARVEPGKQTYRHRLRETEVYYILSGTGVMHIDEESRDVSADEAVVIPPGTVQWIENNGSRELSFIALVNPPWSEEGDE
ncbi:MAG: cupin domain-containing protein, partial [Gammaproteobacteria bacterium]